jgi:ribosomal protein S18 acetylase RimI-like enzyme
MTELKIHTLNQLDLPRLRELIVGYTSTQSYIVRKEEAGEQIIFTLTLQPLAQPFSKNYWDCLTGEDLLRYEGFLAEGFSLGAYQDGQWVGVALAQIQRWNGVLTVWELHVDPACRRQGIGRCLLDELARRAQIAGLRALAVETQNTNAAAIHFYCKAGFSIEGFDLSFYTNDDLETGEVAIFMKRKLV